MPILSYMIFLPLAAAIVLMAIPSRFERLIRNFSLLATGTVLVLSIYMLKNFSLAQVGMQFVEYKPWLKTMNIWYYLGVDGLSAGLVFLTALLGFIACINSFGIVKRVKEYFIFYLLLMTGMMGTFLALDLVLFYIFWEMVLIPMYFLIGIWGGPRREYAAIKFFLYTLAGSVLMLLGILAVYFLSSPHTFNIVTLTQSGFDPRWQMVLFFAFFLAFAVKVPIFPFHTWLPDAHVEAPTPVSVLLAGVLLKMGGYGILRICFPLFKDAAHELAPMLAVLGCINIAYGACVALAQTDFKKMIAYSSVSHMGFVLLGAAALNEAGYNGALLQMFNHGIITGAMFLLVGVLYDRAHTRDLNYFGGLSSTLPKYAFCLTIMTLASLGLPGLAGFAGEFMVLASSFGYYPFLVVIAGLALIITVGYFLYMLERILFRSVNANCSGFKDMSLTELITVVPLIIMTVVLGFCPQILLRLQETAVAVLAH